MSRSFDQKRRGFSNVDPRDQARGGLDVCASRNQHLLHQTVIFVPSPTTYSYSFITSFLATMLVIYILSILFPSANAVNNGLAFTPQMGWNNWNTFGCSVSQSLFLQMSSSLVSTGLRDIGYNHVLLDDCWSDGRDSHGCIRVDETKFPKGMKWLADELHREKFLFGIYSSAGEMTCARYEGSLDFEQQDAQSWAAWGVDYLKYDNCFHKGRFGTPEASFNRFKRMGEALSSTQRPILYSLCNWGEDYVHTWGYSIANSWRISGDIYDHFNRPDALCSCSDPRDPHCVSPGSMCSVMHILNKVTPYVDRGFQGGWNDLDMLEVGLGGMSDEEYKAHFSLWAALKSPLIIGADMSKLTARALTILNNPAVVAVNQDPLGRPAVQISRNQDIKKDKYGQGETQIWSGPLWPKDQVVMFLNAGDEELEMSATLADIFVHQGPGGSAPQTKEEFDIHDLWADRMDDEIAEQILAGNNQYLKHSYNATELPHQEGLRIGDERLLGRRVGSVGPGNDEIKVTVPRHALKMYRLRNLTGRSKSYAIRKDEL